MFGLEKSYVYFWPIFSLNQAISSIFTFSAHFWWPAQGRWSADHLGTLFFQTWEVLGTFWWSFSQIWANVRFSSQMCGNVFTTLPFSAAAWGQVIGRTSWKTCFFKPERCWEHFGRVSTKSEQMCVLVPNKACDFANHPALILFWLQKSYVYFWSIFSLNQAISNIFNFSACFWWPAQGMWSADHFGTLFFRTWEVLGKFW